jgi:hypothetical protein
MSSSWWEATVEETSASFEGRSAPRSYPLKVDIAFLGQLADPGKRTRYCFSPCVASTKASSSRLRSKCANRAGSVSRILVMSLSRSLNVF